MGKLIDMTNWIMKEHGVPESLLTVLYYIPEIKKWHCKCECGNEINLPSYRIRSGNTKSCGCLATKKRQETNSLRGRQIKIGDTFGYLTVIKDLGYRKQNSRDKQWKWSLCQCQCGSAPIETPNALLLNGHKKSCGCMISYGEVKIKEILENNNISFQTQFSFPDLLGPRKGVLRFDFAVFNNKKELLYLIEFDGRNHYDLPEGQWKSYTLEEIQEKDRKKNEYCKSHKILLKRIPYTEQYNFTYEDIISDKYNI